MIKTFKIIAMMFTIFAMTFGFGGVSLDSQHGLALTSGKVAYATGTPNPAGGSQQGGGTDTSCGTAPTPGQTLPTGPACGSDTLINKIFVAAKVLAGIVVAVAVVMIVYAGFKYATSQGDAKTTEQAKMQIITAGIGIFVAAGAFVILQVFQNMFTK